MSANAPFQQQFYCNAQLKRDNKFWIYWPNIKSHAHMSIQQLKYTCPKRPYLCVQSFSYTMDSASAVASLKDAYKSLLQIIYVMLELATTSWAWVFGATMRQHIVMGAFKTLFHEASKTFMNLLFQISGSELVSNSPNKQGFLSNPGFETFQNILGFVNNFNIYACIIQKKGELYLIASN